MLYNADFYDGFLARNRNEPKLGSIIGGLVKFKPLKSCSLLDSWFGFL
jgi:hypothetical protein